MAKTTKKMSKARDFAELRTVEVTAESIMQEFTNLCNALRGVLDTECMCLHLLNDAPEIANHNMRVYFSAPRMQPDWNAVTSAAHKATCENPGHGYLTALFKLDVPEQFVIDDEELRFFIFCALVKQLRQYITTQELWLGNDKEGTLLSEDELLDPNSSDSVLVRGEWCAPTAWDKLFPHARERGYSVRHLLQDDHSRWIQVESEIKPPTFAVDDEAIIAEESTQGKKRSIEPLRVGNVAEDMQQDPTLIVEMPALIPNYVHPRTDKHGVIHFGLCDHMCEHANARPIVG